MKSYKKYKVHKGYKIFISDYNEQDQKYTVKVLNVPPDKGKPILEAWTRNKSDDVCNIEGSYYRIKDIRKIEDRIGEMLLSDEEKHKYVILK